MPPRLSSTLLRDLWAQDSDPLNSRINELCKKLDRQEQAMDFSQLLCVEMQALLKLHRDLNLARFPHLMQRLHAWGGKLMSSCAAENSRASDVFFLGAFIDLKLCENWKKLSFYRLVQGLIKSIQQSVLAFSDELKRKIELIYKSTYPVDYQKYFTSSPFQSR